MEETKVSKTRIRLWAVLFWLFFWQIISVAVSKSLILPSPIEVINKLFAMALTLDFWSSVGFSSVRIFLGFFFGSLLAIIVAVFSSRKKVIQELVEPLVSVMKSVPVASFVILALFWLDIKGLTVFIVFLMVFPVCYRNVYSGIMSVNNEILEMAYCYEIRGIRKIKGIYIPYILPYFRTAMSLSLGLCWKSGVAAEVIGIPKGSIGEKLYTAKIYFLTPELFAITLTIIFLSYIFEKLILFTVDSMLKRTGVL